VQRYNSSWESRKNDFEENSERFEN